MAACNDGVDKDEENNSGTAGDMAVFPMYYSLEIVNNTNNRVELYKNGSFYKNLQTNTIETYTLPDTVECTLNGKGKKAHTFEWMPKHSLYYSDNPEEPDPDAQTIKARFTRYMLSFYLRLKIGGNDYYLAGWPAALNGSITEPPAAKIVQNSIGWAENLDVRIKDDTAYIPFTVRYGNQYKDFDDAWQVYAKATLTINANSKDGINFVTTSLQITEPE
jgi:hypothetical protein